MALTVRGVIALPDGRNSDFDHGAFDPKTRRVFIAHTARDRVEVVDHDASRHLATLPGCVEAAGVESSGRAELTVLPRLRDWLRGNCTPPEHPAQGPRRRREPDALWKKGLNTRETRVEKCLISEGGPQEGQGGEEKRPRQTGRPRGESHKGERGKG